MLSLHKSETRGSIGEFGDKNTFFTCGDDNAFMLNDCKYVQYAQFNLLTDQCNTNDRRVLCYFFCTNVSLICTVGWIDCFSYCCFGEVI